MADALARESDRRYSESVTHIREMLAAAELRAQTANDSQQRAIEVAFMAQQRANDLAFAAQQAGLSAALLAAKEAVATALVAAEKANSAAFISSAQAVQKAETANEKRFESVNEFRATLADQQRLLMPRLEVDALVKALDARIEQLTISYRELVSNAAGASAGWLKAVGVIGLISIIVSMVLAFIKLQK